MKIKRLLTIAVVALILFLVISQPTQAAGIVHSILGTLKSGAQAVISFFKGLIS